ncbi:probable G-protein coupled receptor [Sardina pilchardus]|uniref:probable G-protein coupled receptor n=1 Tax=Sardina pilchardus TaxID=27697 RepID=UPI002E0D79F6
MEYEEPSGLTKALNGTVSNGSLLHEVSLSLPTPSMHLAGGPSGGGAWRVWALAGLALMLALTGVALLANVAVLAVVARAAHLRRRLVFVGHLCAVDLLCATLLMPAGMVGASPLLSGAGSSSSSSSSASSLASPLSCRLYAGLHATLVAASIFTVTAISVERYYYIVHPMRYEAKMTGRLAAAILALLWLVSLLLGFATVLGWPAAAAAAAATANAHGALRARSASCCSLRWSHGGGQCWGFALLFAGVCFCAPATVILGVYGNVYKVARVAARHQHGPVPSWTCKPVTAAAVVGLPKRRSNSVSSQTTIIATVAGRWHGCGGGAGSSGGAPRWRRSPRGGKAAVTLAVIVGQFLLCWLPYFTFHLRLSLTAPPHGAASGGGSEAVAPVTWLAYSSFAANPFFYGLLNRQIRDELAKLLCCCRRRHAGVRPARTEVAAVPEVVVAHDDDFLHFLQRSSYLEATPSACNGSTPRTMLDQSCVRIPGQIPEELA